MTEEAFSAASGVGVVVTEEEVKATVTEVVTASAAALEDNGWGYQFKVIEQVKNRHPFASGATIRAVSLPGPCRCVPATASGT